MKPHIALVGLRASGKSTLGRALASSLSRPFVDLDDAIAEIHSARSGAARVPTGEVLRLLGEPRFRELESQALASALARTQPIVLATGGGVVESPSNRELLRRRARCLWLQVPLPELARRLRADPTPRPALLGRDPVEEIAALAARRAALYREVADVDLDGGVRAPESLVRDALRALGLPTDESGGIEGVDP